MRSTKKGIIGGALAAIVLVASLLVPGTAQAWWARPGWGWHGGWGWRGGVYIGGPAVVVGPPVAYAPAPYRWIPPHYTRWGAYVPAHWGIY